jgi:Ca2+-binding RTX toxin-like protein
MRIGIRIWAALGTSLVCAALAPACASAASVSGGLHIVFQAAPGETNTVVVDQVQNGAVARELAYRIQDSTAPLDAGTGCTSTGPHEAICALTTTVTTTFSVTSSLDTDPYRIRIRAGDGDDSVDIRGFIRLPWIDAGSGNDTVVSRGYGGTIYGGAGNDTIQVLPFDAQGVAPVGVQLWGGSGSDVIYGSEGNDVIEGDIGPYSTAPDPTLEGSDTIHGGGGNDYITDFERTSGNHNVYYGDAGNDTISGGGGPDQIHGGDGTDAIDSYENFAAAPVADSVDCGAATDQVSGDLLDSIAADCESVTRRP